MGSGVSTLKRESTETLVSSFLNERVKEVSRKNNDNDALTEDIFGVDFSEVFHSL